MHRTVIECEGTLSVWPLLSTCIALLTEMYSNTVMMSPDDMVCVCAARQAFFCPMWKGICLVDVFRHIHWDICDLQNTVRELQLNQQFASGAAATGLSSQPLLS